MKICIWKNLLIVLCFLLLSGCDSKYEQIYNHKPAFYSYISSYVHGDDFIEDYNSTVYATPASCQKVITTLVSLKTLGAEYKYITGLYLTKHNNKIYNLIIKFSGDPTLNSDNLINLLRPLKNTKVRGHIILDASIFKTSPYSRNLMIDDIGTDYATPVSAINIDKNLIFVKVFPQKLGEPAVIQVDKGFDIQSDVVTTGEKTAVKITWIDGMIHLTGKINSEDRVLEMKISPLNHDEYILKKIKHVLSLLAIKGKIKIIKNKKLIEKQNKYVHKINRIESAPLREIIKPALKISDNLVFDSIYLSIVNSCADEEIKDWAQGSNIIKNLIKDHFRIDTGGALFVDGSGLSRYNRVQPKTLLFLLKSGFDIPDFLDALPIPGEENSTLKMRTRLSYTIKAKTGSMSGISCLCGYSVTKYNPKVFVFMTSSFAPPTKDLFEVMDNFVSENLR